MRKKTLHAISIACFLMQAFHVYSQCTPDTVNCRDTLIPGQICPEILPDAQIGIAYQQTVTILPPPMAIINDIGIMVYKIEIDTISNLPPGISYQPNAIDLYPDTAYCVQLSGIPTETGEFKLAVNVKPYIMLMDSIIELPVVVNDTSVKITVYESTGILRRHSDDFIVASGGPNPFSSFTTLGFMISEPSPVMLSVYGYTGNLIYREMTDALAGRNIFRFTGGDLAPGCYIYSITNKKTVYSGKLIKSK